MLYSLLPVFTLFITTATFAIGLFFARSRVVFLSMLIFAWQLLYVVKPYEFSLNMHILLSVLIPFSFFVLGVFKERGVFNQSGFAKLLFVLAIFALSFYVKEQFSKYLLMPFIPPKFTSFLHINQVSDLGLVLFLFAVILLFIITRKTKNMVQTAVLVALIFAYLPFLFTLRLSLEVLFLGLSAGALIFALIKDAYKMAYIDTLTNIASRRALEEYLHSLSAPFSLCMVDIDHFKSFNDTYGHDTGDDVLRFIAKELAKTKNAKAFRYGGEEFTIVFAKTLAPKAMPHLEATRQKISDIGFWLRKQKRPNKQGKKDRQKEPKAQKISLTVSMGLSDTNTSKDLQELIKAADKALYKAKESGRNCIKM